MITFQDVANYFQNILERYDFWFHSIHKIRPMVYFFENLMNNFFFKAVWLMPENHPYGTWPASGEIDIIESRG